MHKTVTWFLLLPAYLLITYKVVAQSPSIKQANWLLGSWVMKMKSGIAYENWRFVNDSTFESKCYIIKTNGDTIPQENIKLAYRDNQLYYIPTVHGQNNNQPVTFKITSQKASEFVAENLEHDFPQRIIYILKSPGHLYASIDGMHNNKFEKEEYNMEKAGQ